MIENYKIIKEGRPEYSARGIMGGGVASSNKQRAGDNQFKRLCYILRGSNE